MTEPEHGTLTSYKKNRCRCAACRQANTQAHRRGQQRRIERFVAGQCEHGLNAYNNYGCRCETCKQAKSVQNRDGYLERKNR